MAPVSTLAPPDLECIEDAARASTLLSPLRLRLVGLARAPRSTTELAAEVGMPRQRVHYHVRELARAGLLRRAGRRQRRGFSEQRWLASARTFLLAPEVLGEIRPGPRSVDDRASAHYLLALAARTQSEVARAAREAAAQEKSIATLSLSADLRFESAAQRERFAKALRDAFAEVVAAHSSPASRDDGSPAPGRPFRLVAACHPVPPDPHAPFGTETTP